MSLRLHRADTCSSISSSLAIHDFPQLFPKISSILALNIWLATPRPRHSLSNLSSSLITSILALNVWLPTPLFHPSLSKHRMKEFARCRLVYRGQLLLSSPSSPLAVHNSPQLFPKITSILTLTTWLPTPPLHHSLSKLVILFLVGVHFGCSPS